MLKFYVTHGEGKKTTKSDLHFPSKLYYFFVRLRPPNFHKKSGKKIPARQPLSIEALSDLYPYQIILGAGVDTYIYGIKMY